MDEIKEIKDEVLKGKGLQVSNGGIFPFEKARSYNLIPKDIFKKIDAYLKPIILTASKNRKINVENILENTEFMFMCARHKDNMWIQHCASSFREILVFVYPDHFHAAYQNIPEPSDPVLKKLFYF